MQALERLRGPAEPQQQDSRVEMRFAVVSGRTLNRRVVGCQRLFIVVLLLQDQADEIMDVGWGPSESERSACILLGVGKLTGEILCLCQPETGNRVVRALIRGLLVGGGGRQGISGLLVTQAEQQASLKVLGVLA